MLPFSQARKLPVFVYRNVHFRDLSGEILITEARPGIIRIGYPARYVATAVPYTEWILRGRIIFNGPTYFYRGTYVLVADHATLAFGRNLITCGSNTKIICFESITIGNRVGITWDCQIMDTSFHYLQERREEPAAIPDSKPLTQKIIIGNYVWIGNRTTISPGSVLPDQSIVASNSLVNKDFSAEGPYCLYAGIPASVVKRNIQRVWNKGEEVALDMRYHYPRTHL